MKKLTLLFLSLLTIPLHAFGDLEEDSLGPIAITGELLYWRPHISGLELNAGRNSITQTVMGGSTVEYTNEYDVDPHFQWSAGYRVGATYQFCPVNCGASLIWTHFQNSGTRNVDEDVDTLNSTKCSVKFDQLDFVFTCQTQWCSGCNLKPFIGLRGAKIREKVQANLVTNVLFSPSTLSTVTRTLDDWQNYQGIGPILGFGGELDLGCGFGLYGSAGVGLLYGQSKVYFDDSSVGTAPISKSTFSFTQKEVHTFDWNMDLALGFVWTVPLCDGYTLTFNLGFEHHQYFNQSHLGVHRGDLTFDGAVFGINLRNF